MPVFKSNMNSIIDVGLLHLLVVRLAVATIGRPVQLLTQASKALPPVRMELAVYDYKTYNAGKFVPVSRTIKEIISNYHVSMGPTDYTSIKVGSIGAGLPRKSRLAVFTALAAARLNSRQVVGNVLEEMQRKAFTFESLYKAWTKSVSKFRGNLHTKRFNTRLHNAKNKWKVTISGREGNMICEDLMVWNVQRMQSQF